MATEIRAILFDMGQVLMKFTPERVLSPFFLDKDSLERARRVVFDSGDWTAIDAGHVSETEMLTEWIRAIPEEAEGLRALMASWYRHMEPVEGMTELVAELKAAGYGCYLLSNTSARFFEYADSVPVLRMLDGYLISAVERLSKPDPAIYRRALEKFGRSAEECFFIDDRAENVSGAAFCGIRGFCFENYDVPALRRALRDTGVRI